ncbi:MAG: ferrochelatase [Eggerthellaceae bacterium]|jgi:ferrochelatase
MSSNELRGVVIVNTGSPEAPTPEAVGAYLEQFLSHPRICPMNPKAWSFILRHCILPTRSKKSAAKYQTIWTGEGFQFIIDHEHIAQAVQEELQQAGENVLVRAGMSFGTPAMTDALDELRGAGCRELFVLPLYPQAAFSTVGVVEDDLATWKKAKGAEDVSCHVINGYSDNPLYVRAIAQNIRAAGFDAAAGDVLMMSFHSIPLSDVQNGDTYEMTTHATCEAVAAELGIGADSWTVGYQSRFDKEREWVSPFTDHVFAELAQRDIAGTLYFVCPNFSVDCLETYYDIPHDIEPAWQVHLKEAGKAADAVPFSYVPCLNATPAQVELVSDVLLRAFASEGK